MRNIIEIKEFFAEEGILISFHGSFSHGIIEEIGSAVRRHLEHERLERGIVADVFAVYIEQTQNVRNYLKRKNFLDPAQSSAIVLIVQTEGEYLLCSGNSIAREDVPDLAARLEKINNSDKDALKKMYKEQLRKPLEADATGAGVGLIDIARRATGKLGYRFDRQDESHDFFSLFVKVGGGER